MNSKTGYVMSKDGRLRLPAENYNPSNPEHKKNAETIAFSAVAREQNNPTPLPATLQKPEDMGIYDNVVNPAVTGAVLAVGTPIAAAGYPLKQGQQLAKGAANKMGLRTPSGIPESKKRRLVYSGKPFWQDATSAARGIGNMTGYRTPSGLSQEKKDFAKANPSDDFLSDAQRKYLKDREGLLRKGGRTRRVRRTHKRNSGRKGKGKGKKTRKTRKAKRSRKSRK